MHPAVTYLIYIASALVMLGLFTVIYTGVTRWRIRPDPRRQHRRGDVLRRARWAFRSRSVPASPSMPASPCSWSGAWPRWSCRSWFMWRWRKCVRGMNDAIQENNVAMGGLMGAVSLAAGIVNAACLT